MPVAAPALDVDAKLARLAALKATLSAKGLLVEIPDAPSGPPPLATGWPDVDALLGGGFPRRAITELLGTPASGKTTLAACALGALTRGGSLAAWIDSAGELHPPALAAAGVDLSRLLIVRPAGVRGAGGPPRGARREREARASADDDADAAAPLWAAEVLLQSGTFDAVVLDATGLAAPSPRALDRRAPVLRGAAEANGSALLVLAQEPFGLPAALRVRVAATPPLPAADRSRPLAAERSDSRLRVVVEKSRTGRPGGATHAAIPEPPEPIAPAPPPILARAVKSRSTRRRR